MPEGLAVIFSGDELFAIKVVAVATPVAGLAAFAHVRARRLRARAINDDRASKGLRTVIVEVREGETHGSGSVSIELTPHLLACLSAANSAKLRGYPTPDSVMMAPAVEATWSTVGERGLDEFQATGKLIVTREFVKVRSSPRSIESVRVPLRELLSAHRSTPEGQPLHCEAEGEIRAASTSDRALRVAAARATKDFYWVRAGAAQAPASSSDRKS